MLCLMYLQFVKRAFQEDKARQIFRKTNISYPLIHTRTYAYPDTHTYVCISGGKKCSYFGKFGELCFLEIPDLRFALLPYYQRIAIFYFWFWLSEFYSVDETCNSEIWCDNYQAFMQENNSSGHIEFVPWGGLIFLLPTWIIEIQLQARNCKILSEVTFCLKRTSLNLYLCICWNSESSLVFNIID